MDWQPIATAPRDITPILLADAETIWIGFWIHRWAQTGSGREIFPTHWMPLPDPPK